MADEADNGATAAADELKAKLDRSERDLAIARAGQAEAERRGNLSAAEAQRASTIVARSEEERVTSSIGRFEADAARLKKEKAAALAEGDFDKVGDLDFQMSECAAGLYAAKSDKARLEASKGTERKEAPTQQGFDKEKFLAGRSPAAAAWLRAHDRFFTDAAYQQRVSGASSMALGMGLKIDTPEYFRYVEDNSDGAADGDTRQTERKSGPGAARMSAGGAEADRSARRNGGVTEKVIPPEMVKAAALCEVKPEDYYDGYKKAVEEGKISDRFNLFNGGGR